MVDASPAVVALYQKLGTANIVNLAFVGFGLTNVTGWRATWPPMVAANRPQLIIAMLGGWDLPYIKSNGANAYLAVLNEATTILTAAGGRILWLGIPPPAGPPGVEATVDPILQRAAALHPGIAAYADPAAALTAPNGTAPRWLPELSGQLVLARKPDGWHFCPAGAVRVADFIGAQIAALRWAPAPQPGWEAGSWLSNHVYNDPPGGCDPTLPANAPPR
jgi:lysophospholipase L1-like esterase